MPIDNETKKCKFCDHFIYEVTSHKNCQSAFINGQESMENIIRDRMLGL